MKGIKHIVTRYIPSNQVPMGELTQKQTLGRYFDMGFTFEEDDDHLVQLSFKGAKVDTFNPCTTAEILQGACRDYINGLERAVPCQAFGN